MISMHKILCFGIIFLLHKQTNKQTFHSFFNFSFAIMDTVIAF